MIETRDLSRHYGDVVALDGLNLKVAEGDVFGFIGPNGAGKTTTLRILATLLEPSAGDAVIAGARLSQDRDAIRRAIGYMPDFFGVYDEITVLEYLRFFAHAHGIRGNRCRQVVSDVLDLTELATKADSLVQSLSRGMLQRLGVARLLLHDPTVLLLDEPASGLDPRGRVEMRGLLQELSRLGKTILISSHILWELGTLCNRIAIVDGGRLRFSGTLEQARLAAFGGCTRIVEVRQLAREAEAALSGLQGVRQVDRNGNRIIIAHDEDPATPERIAMALVKGGFGVTHFSEEEVDLETIFQRLTRGPDDGTATEDPESRVPFSSSH